MNLQQAAAMLADELETECLVVELFPAPQPRYDGHMIRCATMANPPWYRRLAAAVPPRHRTSTRCTTGIRRSCVLRALRRIAAGVPRGTSWEELVMPVVRSAARVVDA